MSSHNPAKFFNVLRSNVAVDLNAVEHITGLDTNPENSMDDSDDSLTERVWAIICVLFEGEEYCLLARRSSNINNGGKWGLPGGHAANLVSLREGLLRELYEELGLTLDLGSTLVMDLVLKLQRKNAVHFFYKIRLDLQTLIDSGLCLTYETDAICLVKRTDFGLLDHKQLHRPFSEFVTRTLNRN